MFNIGDIFKYRTEELYTVIESYNPTQMSYKIRAIDPSSSKYMGREWVFSENDIKQMFVFVSSAKKRQSHLPIWL